MEAITKRLRGGLKMKMTDEEKLLYLGNKLKSRRVGLGMTRMDLDKKRCMRKGYAILDF